MSSLLQKRDLVSKLTAVNVLLFIALSLSSCSPAAPEASPDPIPSSTTLPHTLESSASPAAPAIEANILFEGTQGGSQRDIGINLIQTSDGGYALLGYTSSFGASGEDIYLVRLDENGEQLWSQTYGGEGRDDGWDLVQTEDGGFMILGFSDSFSAGDFDLYLVRTDAAGEELWSETYGGPEDEFGWALAASEDGGFALAGQTLSYGNGGNDGFLVKVDSEGRELWTQTYGGDDRDRLFSITAAEDGGYVLAGITKSFGAGNRDAYIVKTNSLGESEWELVVGEAQDDVAHAINPTGDGGYIITGYTQSYGAISWDVYLVKTDAAGELEWRQTYGGSAEDGGYTVMQTSEGNYMLVGHSYSAGEGRGDLYYLLVEVP